MPMSPENARRTMLQVAGLVRPDEREEEDEITALGVLLCDRFADEDQDVVVRGIAELLVSGTEQGADFFGDYAAEPGFFVALLRAMREVAAYKMTVYGEGALWYAADCVGYIALTSDVRIPADTWEREADFADEDSPPGFVPAPHDHTTDGPRWRNEVILAWDPRAWLSRKRSAS